MIQAKHGGTNTSTPPRAVVLISGGLDSTTVLALALREGFACYGLSFDYGQRSRVELEAASKIARHYRLPEHLVIRLELDRFGGSALTDHRIAVPEETAAEGIPISYVPARNTLFLSHALAWAEVLECWHIFIGVNHIDYSGYPDCRPEYIVAFETMANLATRAGVSGERRIRIRTPLIELGKADIIRLGTEMGVDYTMTISCYHADAQGRACGRCDACRFRKTGFAQAELPDPTTYKGH